jgi:hypothetical protein
MGGFGLRTASRKTGSALAFMTEKIGTSGYEEKRLTA